VTIAPHGRLHALDAVRGFALLLGVVFHAGLSFTPGMVPGFWAAVDNSPSALIGALGYASHTFRMSLFFLVAGFFARLLFHRRGARGFWTDRVRRIAIPLVVGWLILAPTLAGIWVWGLTRTFGGTLPAPPVDMPAPPAAAFPLTHLWFLYYLLILYVIVVGIRALLVALDRDGVLRRAGDAVVHTLVRTGSAALVLPVPLIAALLVHPQWHPAAGIPTPDQSLIPQLASLVGYGTAVAFGWMLHRQTDLLPIWARQWPGHLTAALLTTVAALALLDEVEVAATGFGMSRLGYVVAYGLAVWCWTFALIGLAVRYLSREITAVRYVADASYWIYLVHLPVVVVGQVLVSDLPWHWSVKFPAILVVSFGVLFLSYHLLVRSTFIGRALSGRTPVPDVLSPGTEHQHALLGSLRGVRKHYGTTLAVAGLDLEVRRGELLAVLGPNGAGKSTAIAMWLGLLEPDAGTVRLFGHSPLDVEARGQVGVMMQDVELTPLLTVREQVELTASYYAQPLGVDETLALTGLASIAARRYRDLSGGQKRQVQFALAICGRPRLVFLDEPTVGLDQQAREQVWGTIRRLIADGCAVLLTTHYLEEAEALADRVAVMVHGTCIAEGSVTEMRALVSSKRVSCVSDIDAHVVRQWPGVVEVTRDAGHLHVTASEAEAVVQQLFRADPGLRHLEVRQASLADAFKQLTLKETA
jgi:ABC-type multidrug transport system ATPase subunit/peptidoglycan/LPS O-acetylase OafA/YrhL